MWTSQWNWESQFVQHQNHDTFATQKITSSALNFQHVAWQLLTQFTSAHLSLQKF